MQIHIRLKPENKRRNWEILWISLVSIAALALLQLILWVFFHETHEFWPNVIRFTISAIGGCFIGNRSVAFYYWRKRAVAYRSEDGF